MFTRSGGSHEILALCRGGGNLSAVDRRCVAQEKPRTLSPPEQKLEAYKAEAAASVESMAKLAQVMVDSVFSFGELGFQEIETSRYLTGILAKNGFTIRRGVSIFRRHGSRSGAPVNR